MAYVNVQVNQTRLERRIYYTVGPVHATLKANESLFLKWHDNRKGTGTSSTDIPLHEIGEYNIHIYCVGCNKSQGAFYLTAPAALKMEEKRLGDYVDKYLFHVAHLGQHEYAIVRCNLSGIAGSGSSTFECEYFVMILEQII